MSERKFQRYAAAAAGYAIIPLLFAGSLLLAGWKEYNLTGILQIEPYAAIVKAVCAAVYLFMCFLLHRCGAFRNRRMPALLTVSALLSLLIPYMPENMFVSNLHILCSYIAFILLNVIVLPVFLQYRNIMRAYIMALVFGVLHCMTYSSITGPAEAVYACMMSVCLTYCALKHHDPDA